MTVTRLRDLALVALAGGLLTFEAVGLRAALPAAVITLAEQRVLGDLAGASTRAALGTARVFAEAGVVASRAVAGAARETARLFGTEVSPPAVAEVGAGELPAAVRGQRQVRIAIVQVNTRGAWEVRRTVVSETRIDCCRDGEAPRAQGAGA